MAWAVLRSWNFLAQASPDIAITNLAADKEDEKDMDSVMTREEGLQELQMLIDRKPIPDNREDVLRFLRDFKANCKRWQVTKQDLRNIYMTQCTYAQLMRQLAMTYYCCPNYEQEYLNG